MSQVSWWRRLFAFLFPTDPDTGPGPVEVFDEAIRGSRRRFLDVRAAAAPLYQARDNLREQDKQQSDEVASLKERAVRLLGERREPEALELAARQGRLEADLGRTRQELVELAGPIGRAEEQLRRIEAEIRDLERERDRSASALEGAQAREAVDRILAAGRDDRQVEALREARDLVAARVARAKVIEELSAGTEERKILDMEREQELNEARARLEGLKAALELPPGDDRSDKNEAGS